jgi:CBS domain-containing protein
LVAVTTAQLAGVNTFLTAFAAGVTTVSFAAHVASGFRRFGDTLTELLKLGALLLFGASIAPQVFVELGWRGWVFVLVALLLARPVAVGVALVGSRLTGRERLAAAWFGPKGFSSVFYSLLILTEAGHGASRLFDLVAVVIVASMVAHSSTDVPIARWFNGGGDDDVRSTERSGGRGPGVGPRAGSRASTRPHGSASASSQGGDMAQTIRDVMTRDPISYPESTTVADAAKAMRDRDTGDVLVESNGAVCGIVTDRDIVVRVVAEGKDPSACTLGEMCSHTITTVAPDDPVDKAVQIMREKAVRRLPVCEGDHAIGIVSLGDLAVERDPQSALADISAAPPNG